MESSIQLGIPHLTEPYLSKPASAEELWVGSREVHTAGKSRGRHVNHGRIDG
jgi:hypothetical protein